MMLAYVLLAALLVVVVVDRVLADRKDRRHAAQVDRLLLWRHDPEAAALPEASDGPLYLPLEDDEAWNEAHGRTKAGS